jgi:predicted 3-demethylubiquinone-9 3-methyltransferase (glyoxalase superfamily)
VTITGVNTFLWFDDCALEAAEFYVSTFPGAVIDHVDNYPGPDEKVMTVSFRLFDKPFVALNGGPVFTHSPAISFQVFCDTQDEIDQLWDRLTSEGGSESQCGWCQDKFGVSWQVIPSVLGEKLGSPDPEVSQRAFGAMMQMKKFIIADLG